jgi:hypothetical protein
MSRHQRKFGCEGGCAVNCSAKIDRRRKGRDCHLPEFSRQIPGSISTIASQGSKRIFPAGGKFVCEGAVEEGNRILDYYVTAA